MGRQDHLAQTLLVRRVRVTVQQADGDALDPRGGNRVQHRRDRGFVQRNQRHAVHIQTLAHGQPPGPAHQRHGLDDIQVVLLEPALRAHFEHVPEALGGDEQGLRAAPFDQGVGRERRAMDDLADLAERDPGGCAGRRHAVQHGAFRLRPGSQQFDRMESAVAMLQREIGKGAADVHSNSVSW